MYVFTKSILCVFVSVLRFSFASGSPDNIKQWKFPDGNFLQNITGHTSIINTLAVNSDGVLVSGGRLWEGCTEYLCPTSECLTV